MFMSRREIQNEEKGKACEPRNQNKTTRKLEKFMKRQRGLEIKNKRERGRIVSRKED